MSATNPMPIFSLVREDSLRYSEAASLRYGAAVPGVDTAYDEIRLVAPNGEPCAMPRPGHQNRDVESELASGGRTGSPRVIETAIDLGIDYIDNTTRRRLERWMYDRARVLFTPGYGAKTELAWRPVDRASAAIYDLTGRWQVQAVHDPASAYVWDQVSAPSGLMRLFSTSYAKLVRTPFGAGQVFGTCHQNRFGTGTTPPGSYPVGTSDADSGWGTWGAWAADVTRAFVSAGFGCTDCPGALRVYSATRRTGDGTNDRVLGREIPAAAAGAASVWCGVFLKGRGGSGIALRLGHSNGLYVTKSLVGVDLSEWTLCWISAYHASWPGVSANQTLKIDVTPAVGVTDDFDLLVGPSVCVIQADVYEMAPAHPNWLPYTRTTGDEIRVNSFLPPRSGSALFSFYVPPYWTYAAATPWVTQLMQVAGSNAGRFFVHGGSSRYPNARLLYYWGPGAGDYMYANILSTTALVPGRVATFGVTWDGSGAVLYCNGVAVATKTGSPQPITTAANTSFWGMAGTYGAGGLIPLSMRIDNEVFTAGMMADLHRLACDAGASDLAVSARGRVYQIDSIPSASRNTAGGTLWLGTLGLRQVDYIPALADVTSKEV